MRIISFDNFLTKPAHNMFEKEHVFKEEIKSLFQDFSWWKTHHTSPSVIQVLMITMVYKEQDFSSPLRFVQW